MPVAYKAVTGEIWLCGTQMHLADPLTMDLPVATHCSKMWVLLALQTHPLQAVVMGQATDIALNCESRSFRKLDIWAAISGIIPCVCHGSG